MKSFPRPVVLLIAGITANAAAVLLAGSASEVRERKVDVGEGVSLRIIEAGQAGPGPTLVFIPGWSTGADIWREQIDRFASTYRVIAFDPRSQGQSTITTNGDTPEIALLLGKGQSLLHLDQTEEAIACFNEVLALDPQHTEALVKKGAALEKMLTDDFELRTGASPGNPTPRAEWTRQALAKTDRSARIEQMAVHDLGSHAIVSICADGGQGTVALLEN